MLQSIIIIDPKIELSTNQNANTLLIQPLADNKGKLKDISIAQIRQMVLWANQTAFLNQQRLVVITHASRLGLEAQQALLKTLEEPAEDVTIIICPQQATDLLPTIRSRCATFQLNQLSSQQLADWQLIQSPPPAGKLQTPNSKLPSLQKWLTLDSWQQFNTLAEYLKSKKDPQQLLQHWLNELTESAATPHQIKQAGQIDQALQALQNYAPPRLVFTRLHYQLQSREDSSS